ncbi:MAG: hypothetical protein WA191_05885, partial [Telluria sp.]
VEQAGQRFYAVAIDKNHTSSSVDFVFRSLFSNRKATTASAWLIMVPELLRNSQSAPFTSRPEGRGFSEQI